MKLGAEPWKMAILIGFASVAAYLGYSTLVSSDEPESYQPLSRPVLQTVPPRPDTPQAKPNIARDRRDFRGGTRAAQEFRLGMKRRPEDSIDPTTVDPTLRLDLLAKLQSITIKGGERSLFDFAQAPQPPAPKQPPHEKIIPKPFGPQPPPAQVTKAAPVKPPPPPIPLKFYGFINPARTDLKRAFFLDGEDIIVASEGELIRKRYKVVRIGLNSVVMEDLEHKHQQTLPLVEDQQPG